MVEQIKELKAMKKGFTLIELLIVIGILAILATTVVLVLNPAQILAEARDADRVSELKAVNTAISIYLARVSNPDLVKGVSPIRVCTSKTDSVDWSATGGAGTTSPLVGVAYATTSRLVNGSSWVRTDFTVISGGSPLSVLPVDPTNVNPYAYCYAGSSTANTYELNANMESTKFANGGSADIESKDGGDRADWYEIGSDPGLNM